MWAFFRLALREKNRPIAKIHDGGVERQASGVKGRTGASVLQHRLQLAQGIGGALPVTLLQTEEKFVPGIAFGLEAAGRLEYSGACRQNPKLVPASASRGR